MIKLIASDIDGTLVKEGSHEISPEYFEVIEELKDVGIRFCACSGRQYASMLDLFRPSLYRSSKRSAGSTAPILSWRRPAYAIRKPEKTVGSFT